MADSALECALLGALPLFALVLAGFFTVGDVADAKPASESVEEKTSLRASDAPSTKPDESGDDGDVGEAIRSETQQHTRRHKT